MNVIGMSFEKVVSKSCSFGRNSSVGICELFFSETCIDILGDAVQINLLCAVVEGLGCRVEHILKNMPITAGIDEQAVVHFLNMGAK